MRSTDAGRRNERAGTLVGNEENNIAVGGDRIQFGYRVAAVIVEQDRVLLQTVDGSFWFLPGGGVKLGELAADALRREMQEELGVDVEVGRLLWVVENLFESGGRLCHGLELYFAAMVSPESRSHISCDAFGTAETYITGGVETRVAFTFAWQPVDTLDRLTTYPPFVAPSLKSLPQALKSLPQGAEHIVQDCRS